ncbi:MAG: sugar ABC transporter permease [Fimbriimonas sp.]|nr:sugar ABC transporter permease [Fimbriimonas sp.]
MKSLRTQTRLANLFVIPYGMSFVVFIICPIVFAAVLAFTQLDLTSRQHVHFVGFDNFREALKDPYFVQATQVTCLYSVLIVPAFVILSFGLALGLQGMAFGRNTVRGMLFLPGMFNVVVASIIWRWFYDGEFGFFNYLLKREGLTPIHWLGEKTLALPSIVVMSLWWGLGGATIILLAALEQVPIHLYEAAMIDGATSRKLLTKITIPQMRPVLLFIVVTSTIGAFQVFGQTFMMTNGGPDRSTTGLVQLIYDTAFNKYRLGYAASISWLLFFMISVIIIAQALLLRRSID